MTFHSRRHRHTSGWCGGAVAVLGTYRPHPEGLVGSQYRYDQEPPWSVLVVCIPRVPTLMGQSTQVCKVLLSNSCSKVHQKALDNP